MLAETLDVEKSHGSIQTLDMGVWRRQTAFDFGIGITWNPDTRLFTRFPRLQRKDHRSATLAALSSTTHPLPIFEKPSEGSYYHKIPIEKRFRPS